MFNEPGTDQQLARLVVGRGSGRGRRPGGEVTSRPMARRLAVYRRSTDRTGDDCHQIDSDFAVSLSRVTHVCARRLVLATDLKL